jgi:hypothetical protein
MIDNYKTALLRNRLQEEKEKENSSETQETLRTSFNENLHFLVSFLIAYFVFYGSQWIILNHFTYSPFTMLESFIMYLLLRNLPLKKTK